MSELSIPTTEVNDSEATCANRDIYFHQLEDGSGKKTGIIQVQLSCNISSNDEGEIAIIKKEDLVKQLKKLLSELDS